jgi:hypothetical protein
VPTPSSGKTACDCICFTFSGQGKRPKRWHIDIHHLTGQADSRTFPRILWTTLWANPRGRSEVLDFAGFSALLKKPAAATLSQKIKDLALFMRSLR